MHLNYSSVLKRLLPSALLLLVGTSVSMSQTVAKKPVVRNEAFFGTVKDDVYTNAFFGFSFPIPKGYTVVQHEEAAVYNNAGVDMLKDDSAAKSKVLDKSLATQATLLGVAEKPIGEPENAVLEIVVVKQPPNETADSALVSNLALMTSTGKLTLTKSLKHPTFGGRIFAGALVGGEFNGVKISQEMYVTIRKGYSLSVALTYSTDEGRNHVIGILEKIKFTTP